MPDLDFESAQLQLLTDALRAGPGTPIWRDALAAIEVAPGEDEFKLLCTARERLASGREYREVRAGPAFTRKVLDSIAQQETADRPGSKIPWTSVIAGISLLVVIAIIAIVVSFALPRKSPSAAGASDLSQTYFTLVRSQSQFDSRLGADWSAFGPLAVSAASGLRPKILISASAPGDYQGGGVVYQHQFPANQPFAIEATLRAPKSSEDLITQVFVADAPDFAGERATSAHELVWLLRDDQASVALPDGTIAGQTQHVPAGRNVDVRVALNLTQASVETNGKRLWSGLNELAANKPRTLGVRFLIRGRQSPRDLPTVESVKILVPQQP